jgi:hypothetical protein
VSDRLFNRLHVSARSLRLAGAGLALMILGSAAVAQNAANGKDLYTAKFCSFCHLADPTLNRDGILEGANDPQRILQECQTEPSMVQFCSQGSSFDLSLAEATDIAAYLANPNDLGAAIAVDPQTLTYRRSVGGGASGRQTVTVSNPGDADLLLNNVQLAGNNPGDYALLAPASGTRCEGGTLVAAKASCTVDIVFDPSVVGTRNARLDITPDGDLEVQTVALNGTATAEAEPFATADVATLNFGNQLLNATATKTIVVTNQGEADLTFDAVDAFLVDGANAAEYVVADSGTCVAGGSVAAEGGSCTLQVQFTPVAAGSRQAVLTAGSNGEDLTISLAGNGQAADNNEGEGGCSIGNPNTPFDPVLLSLLAAALAVLRMRRRQL